MRATNNRGHCPFTVVADEGQQRASEVPRLQSVAVGKHGNFNGPAIRTWTEIGLQGYFWPGVIFCIAIPEVFSLFNHNNPLETGEWRTHRTEQEPGNYLDFDPLGLKPDDPEELLDKQNKELNNGRLAMLGISGMIAQELVNGQKIIDTLQQKAR